ncbi:MAG: hypothetical protein LLG02_05220 [Pelosinus sp.]|nr:hypothetical protein [Pelosinus sp.]
MNKKTIIAFTASATLLTGVASAAPLTDYSAGKTSIDLTWRNTEISGNSGTERTFDKNGNMDWGITTGLGNNFAIQYRQFNPESKDTTSHSNPSVTTTMKGKVDTQEFNVLYKIDKNVAVYTGIMKTKAYFNRKDTVYGSDEYLWGGASTSKNRWQIGVVGSAKLAEKTTGYASLAAGKDLTSWELGIAQEVAPNVDFNISYREIKANNNSGGDFGSTNIDGTAKGLGFGISYKF